MDNPNQHIFDCFTAERKRRPEIDAFYYRKETERNDASLRYANQDGVLTVLFKKDGSEEFYFKQRCERGIGDKVQVLQDNGKYGKLFEKFHSMPALFRSIAQDYQYNRQALCLDKQKSIESEKNKSVKKNGYERE